MVGSDALVTTVTLLVCVGMNRLGGFPTSGRLRPVIWVIPASVTLAAWFSFGSTKKPSSLPGAA